MDHGRNRWDPVFRTDALVRAAVVYPGSDGAESAGGAAAEADKAVPVRRFCSRRGGLDHLAAGKRLFPAGWDHGGPAPGADRAQKMPRYAYIAAAVILAGSLYMEEITVSVPCTVLLMFGLARVYSKRRAEGEKNSLLYQYSFMIYVLHGKILSVLQILIMGAIADGLWIRVSYFALPLAVIGICIAAARLLRLLLPRVYAVLSGGR